MKIAQINGSYGNADSTGRNVKEMHEWLIGHGIQSTVYAAVVNDGKCTDPNVHLYSTHMDRSNHAICSRVIGLQGYFSTTQTKRLLTRLASAAPDIVILHVLHNNSLNFPLLCNYLAQNDIPTILVLHDCWYFTGHCCYYTEVGCEKWKTNCKGCPQIHEWNASWMFDTAEKCLADKQKWFTEIPRLAVVGVSDWITNEAKQSILKNAAEIRRIYNWIDLDIFKPQNTDDLRRQLGVAHKQPVLLGVASGWSNKKGLAEILQITKEMPQAVVLMVGDMPADVQVPKNVHCLGTIKKPHILAQYYAVADVFLNPSKQETFGKTTAEAICCGTPVVAYDTTACTELVGQGCGIVVENENAAAFIKAVADVVERGKKSYQEVCLDFAARNFSTERSLRKYIDLFEKLQQMK